MANKKRLSLRTCIVGAAASLHYVNLQKAPNRRDVCHRERSLDDRIAAAGCVNNGSSADIHRNMINHAVPGIIEADNVSRLNVSNVNGSSHTRNRIGVVRQRDSVLGAVNIINKSGALESAR